MHSLSNLNGSYIITLFQFPEYPPPGTPDPNATLANGAAPLPYGVASDPALSDAYIHFDTGTYGPQIELFHAYYNYWPTVSCITSALASFILINGFIDLIARVSVLPVTAPCSPASPVETKPSRLQYSIVRRRRPPGPSLFIPPVKVDRSLIVTYSNSEEYNTPPAFANESNPGYSIATDKLIFVQSVVVDGTDRVWALDTGRPRVNGTILLAAVPGGPKLVGFYLNGTNFATYTFPDYVVYADSSLNDVRFDLRGGGYAYITDSSPNEPGIVVIDLSTGVSWRHLSGHPAVTPDTSFVPAYNGGTIT